MWFVGGIYGFGAELRKATLYVADRRSLFYLIEGDKYILQSRKKKTISVVNKLYNPSYNPGWSEKLLLPVQ